MEHNNASHVSTTSKDDSLDTPTSPSSSSMGSTKSSDVDSGKQSADVITVPPTHLVDVDLTDRDNDTKLMRTATCLNTFYLLTCDVLGPANAPYSFATLGMVPGCLMYFFGGLIAAYTGMVLSRLYMHYDTEAAPLRTYGDISERVFAYYGPRWAKAARTYTAVLQSLQLLLNVAVIILGSGQALYQIADYNVCFISMTVAFTAAGFLVGFIKQLRSLSHIANSCIYINIGVCIATLAVAATSSPMTSHNHPAPSSLLSAGFVPYDPVTGEGLLPAKGVAFSNMPLDATLSGLGNLVYAWGGATVFIELMAEMRDPRDFWKCWSAAVLIIWIIYFSYGVALYAMQGPYVGNPGNQGISNYAWQTAFNALGLFTGLVAAVLYSNVGMKVIYITVSQELLNAPPLTTRNGTIAWCMFATAFWWLAFMLAESIPQFSAFTSIVSALCIMQFTYVLPPFFQLLHELHQDQTWRDKLLRRWWLKLTDLILFLGSVAMTGLMLWSSISVLIRSVQTGSTQQFGCKYA